MLGIVVPLGQENLFHWWAVSCLQQQWQACTLLASCAPCTGTCPVAWRWNSMNAFHFYYGVTVERSGMPSGWASGAWEHNIKVAQLVATLTNVAVVSKWRTVQCNAVHTDLVWHTVVLRNTICTLWHPALVPLALPARPPSSGTLARTHVACCGVFGGLCLAHLQLPCSLISLKPLATVWVDCLTCVTKSADKWLP